MPKIQIDELEYNTEDLSEAGIAQLQSLQFVDQKLKDIAREVAVYRTAQNTYLQALREEIAKSGIQPINQRSEAD